MSMAGKRLDASVSSSKLRLAKSSQDLLPEYVKGGGGGKEAGGKTSQGDPPTETSFRPSSTQEWPRQTKPKKGQFMNFSQWRSGTKVQCESCLLSLGKTPEFTTMGAIHGHFVLAFLWFWFAGATPDQLATFCPPPGISLTHSLRDPRKFPQATPSETAFGGLPKRFSRADPREVLLFGTSSPPPSSAGMSVVSAFLTESA